MKNSVFILSLCITSFCFAQKNYLLNTKDSLRLVETWSVFSNALLSNNKEDIYKNSLNNIYCITCSDFKYDLYSVYIDKFYLYINEFIKTTDLKSLIQSDKKTIFVTVNEDYQPTNYKKKENKDFIVYNIGFEFSVLINLTPDDQIESSVIYIFKFIKIRNKYVFYGFDILP